MNGKRLFFLVGILFLLSGMASLMYQIVWFKELSYFMGNSTYAQSVVIAAFMGGLAIGSWWFGKKADKSSSPLKLFALLELGIGVYCFIYPYIFDIAESLLFSITSGMGSTSDSGSVLLLKFIFGGVILLIPTTLMGGTLPLLVRHFTAYLKELGRNISFFYFINSLGAMFGVILAGFYLVEYIGLRNTVYMGATLEILVGLTAFIISRNKVASITEADERTIEEKSNPQSLKWLVLVAGLSGFTAMIYEVVWVRMLIPILGSTTYSFSLMLAAFIGGIALGSLVIFVFIQKIKNIPLLVGILQFILVAFIFFTIPVYGKLPFTFWKATETISHAPEAYSSFMRMQFMVVYGLMVVPTFIMGITLPLINRMYIQSGAHIGRGIGSIFAVNTLGTVLGSLGVSLLFIPVFGIIHSFEFALGINFILGIWILLKYRLLKKGPVYVSVALTVFSFIYFYSTFDETTWVKSVMTSDLTRKINRQRPPETFEAFIGGERSKEKILFYKEGVGGTIAVGQKGQEIALFTNGKGDANSVGDLPTQMSLAHIPMILHPDPENVFVIGFGAGTTIGNVLLHDEVKQAEVAEISKDVVVASKYFEEVNQKPLEDKRLTVIYDDGVSALRLSDRKYDVIISQPSNPWSAGVGNLFTSEFFKDCKGKLKPGGIVAQWLNLYEMDDASMKLILRTIEQEFKNISVWQIGVSDVVLLCSDVPFDNDLKRMEAEFEKIAEPLRKIHIKSFPTFLSQQFAGSKQVFSSYAGQGTLNTEDHPLLEYMAPRALFLNATPKEFIALDERGGKNDQLYLAEYRDSNKLSNQELLDLGMYHIYHGNREYGLSFGQQNPLIYIGLAQYEKSQGNLQGALEYLKSTEQVSDTIKEIYLERSIIYSQKNNHEAALEALSRAIELDKNNSELFFERGVLHEKLNQLSEAEADYIFAIDKDPKNIQAYNNLATIKGKKNETGAVIRLMDRAISIDPNVSSLYFNRGAAKGVMRDYNGAANDFTEVIKLDPSNLQAYFMRGKSYQKLGKMDQAMNDFRFAAGSGHQASQQMLQQLER